MMNHLVPAAPNRSERAGGPPCGDSNQFEKMKNGDNTSANEIVRYIAKKLGLNKPQANQLHRAISKMGYSIEEIWDIAMQIKGG